MKSALKLTAGIFALFLFMKCNPGVVDSPPILNSISPTSCFSNILSFTITAKGSGFKSGTKIVFNNHKMLTNFVSSNELTCQVNPEDTILDLPAGENIAESNNIKVYIENPGITESARLDFEIINQPAFITPKALDIKTTIKSEFGADLSIDGKGMLYIVFHDESGLYLLNSTDQGANWNAAVTINEISNWMAMVDLVCDESDNLNLAYTVDRKVLYFTRSTDSGRDWKEPVKIKETNGGRLIRYPRLCSGKKGILIIVWWEADGVDDPRPECHFSYTTDGGKSWKAAQELAKGQHPCGTVDDNDDFYTVWCSHDHRIKFKTSNDNGYSWINQKDLTKGIHSSIFNDRSGNLVVLSGLGLFRSADKGASWTEVIHQISDQDYSLDERMVEDPYKNFHVIWCGGDLEDWPYFDGVYYSRSVNQGKNWTEKLEISNRGDYYCTSINAVDNKGIVYVIWLVEDKNLSNQFTLHFTRSEN